MKLNQVIGNWFSGRLNRRNYLLSLPIFAFPFLVAFLVYWAAAIIYAVTGIALNTYNYPVLALLYNFWLLAMIVWYALFPLGATIRRFHDRNKSGWYSLFMLIPLVNIFFSFYLFFAPSVEPNKFGEANKGWSIKQVVGL
jgi:uncharacterized membrane protein YhaH (DUF805 family)